MSFTIKDESGKVEAYIPVKRLQKMIAQKIHRKEDCAIEGKRWTLFLSSDKGSNVFINRKTEEEIDEIMELLSGVYNSIQD